MDRILVSACLMGRPVRWDGGHRLSASPWLARWRAGGRLVVICPELSAGLPVPRPPAEIAGGDGTAVLAGDACVVTRGGEDQSAAFRAGALAALEAAQRAGCRHAILADRSPSCGSGEIHAGRFDGSRRAGHGVTAALLAAHGIRIWSEDRIDDLAAHLGETAPA